MTRFALLAVLVLGAGCKLVVLGDSNSCFARPCGPNNWPGILQRRLWYRGWRVVNRSAPGMTAGRFANPMTGRDMQIEGGDYAAAGFHLEDLLTELHLARACRWYPALAPVLVLAVGTNDIAFHDGETVAADILVLRSRVADVAACVRVYVGLIPPRASHGRNRDAELERANAILRERVPADRLIDFATGFGRDDLLEDGVHLTAEAQAKRAVRARQAIFRTS